MRRVCVFCGSSSGRLPAYAEAARAFGALVAARGLGLVYGGGRVGLMGAVADDPAALLTTLERMAAEERPRPKWTQPPAP